MNPCHARLPLFAAVLLLGARAPAQTPAAAPPPASTDEVVTLAEFNVSASAENSYVAGDTVSGSRMNTKVKDLPYAVSSITSEFIKDNMLFDLTEDLSFISAVSGNDDSGAFTVRGFTGANTYLRNGHQRLGLIDVGSIDRVELIKGPAGSIYGQTNPGGALNITTRRPRSTPHQSFSASYGSYRLSSDQVHFTGPVPLGKKPVLFYNIDGTFLRRHYDEPAQVRTQKALAAVLLFKPTENTNLTVESNYQSFKNPNEFGIPYLIHTGKNPFTGANATVYDGYAWELRHGHYVSPTDWKWRRAIGYTVTLEHRFSGWLSGRASYDYYHNPIETYDTLRSGGNFDANNRTINRSSTSPNWATIYGSGHSLTGELLAPHYKFLGADHQTLLTVDDYLNNRRDYAKTAIAGTFTPLPATSVPINPFGPVNSVFIPMDDAHFTSQTTRNNAVDSAGAGLTHRATFFERLILDLRYRHDYVRGFQQAPNAATTALAYTPSAASGIPPAVPGSGREARIHDSNDLYSVSFSYRLTPSLSWYAARTGSFIPFGTSVPLTVTGTIVDPRTLKPLNPSSETGVGYETGFKGEFLDRALIFSVDGFDTRRQNVGVSELSNPNDPSSPTVTLNEGDQRSKGLEVDGQYLIARKLLLYVSYSYVDSKVANQGVNVAANGHRPRATPYNSFAGSLSYEVRPGLRLLVSMRGQGNTPAESPTTGLIRNAATGLNEGNDGRINLRTPAFVVWNAGAVYRWRTRWENLDHAINVSAKNIFDRRYIAPGNNKFVGDGFGVYATYSLLH